MISFRVLKVDKTRPYPDGEYVYPRLRLQGKWLEDIGFKTGDRVVVKGKPNQIVIETASIQGAGEPEA